MSNKRVLITGGAGFIGSNLANQLVAKGYEVVVLDVLLEQIHGNNPLQSPLYLSIKDKVEFIQGSILDKELLYQALQNIDVVVHYAAETGTGQSMYEVHRYTEVNISGTALLLDYLVNQPNKVSKVIIASSRSIYGEGKYQSEKYGVVYPKHRDEKEMLAGNFEVKYLDDYNLTCLATSEDSKIHPSSVYGITKQNQEQMVMTVCASIKVPAVALRYQNVYGPGQSLSNPYTGILSIFSTQIKNKLPLNIFEDGLETRDFVFIDDVVEATILAIEKEEANGNIFNVGSGEATTVNYLAKSLVENYNADVPIHITGKFRLGDIRHNFADLTLIQNALGFLPRVKFDDGIKRFCDWVNTQEVNASRYENSIIEMKNRGLFK
ncbi:MAG: NAD-dependent epimerase/dehydratase family protein [Bacteroidota bacterium]